MNPNKPRMLPLVLTSLLLLPACVRHGSAADYGQPQLLVETGHLATRLADPMLRIVDVRSAEAYADGHIPGAVHLAADDVIDPRSHVPGALLPDRALAERLGGLGIDRDTEVLFYDDQGGLHAARLFWMLEYLGHRQARILNGGFPRWAREDRPVSRAEPRVEAGTFAITTTPRRLATADWLLERRNDSKTVVIDVRPDGPFKAGHIPWAQNIPWKQNLAADDTLKSADELMAHFAAHGVTKDKAVAVHCQNGKAAAHSYFTLRLLGYPRVRSYDRSWAEWGSADDLPKESGI
ncbi:MAG: sulfurtransferase [Rhodocyclaceae bacterium]|nr:sulfurtransferase [Rhodocyclaceae bacterium]